MCLSKYGRAEIAYGPQVRFQGRKLILRSVAGVINSWQNDAGSTKKFLLQIQTFDGAHFSETRDGCKPDLPYVNLHKKKTLFLDYFLIL